MAGRVDEAPAVYRRLLGQRGVEPEEWEHTSKTEWAARLEVPFSLFNDTLTRLGLRRIDGLETLLRVIVSLEQDRLPFSTLEAFFGRATTIGELADLERWLKVREMLSPPSGLRRPRGPRKKKEEDPAPTP